MNKTNSGIGTSMGIWAAAAIVDIVLWLVNGESFNIVNLFILLILFIETFLYSGNLSLICSKTLNSLQISQSLIIPDFPDPISI